MTNHPQHSTMYLPETYCHKTKFTRSPFLASMVPIWSPFHISEVLKSCRQSVDQRERERIITRSTTRKHPLPGAAQSQLHPQCCLTFWGVIDPTIYNATQPFTTSDGWIQDVEDEKDDDWARRSWFFSFRYEDGSVFVLVRPSGQLHVRTNTLAPSLPCGQNQNFCATSTFVYRYTFNVEILFLRVNSIIQY